MKGIKFIMLVAALVTCISCSEENNDPEVNQGILLGEWQLEEMNYSGTTSVAGDGQTSTVSYAAEAIDINAQVTFTDASNYSTKGSYTIRMHTTVEGETAVQNFPYTNINGSGTYRIEGNKIFTNPGTPSTSDQEFLMDSSEGTLMELTENRMVIFIEEEVNSTVENMELNVTYEVIQIFSR